MSGELHTSHDVPRRFRPPPSRHAAHVAVHRAARNRDRGRGAWRPRRRGTRAGAAAPRRRPPGRDRPRGDSRHRRRVGVERGRSPGSRRLGRRHRGNHLDPRRGASPVAAERRGSPNEPESAPTDAGRDRAGVGHRRGRVHTGHPGANNGASVGGAQRAGGGWDRFPSRRSVVLPLFPRGAPGARAHRAAPQRDAHGCDARHHPTPPVWSGDDGVSPPLLPVAAGPPAALGGGGPERGEGGAGPGVPRQPAGKRAGGDRRPGRRGADPGDQPAVRKIVRVHGGGRHRAGSQRPHRAEVRTGEGSGPDPARPPRGDRRGRGGAPSQGRPPRPGAGVRHARRGHHWSRRVCDVRGHHRSPEGAGRAHQARQHRRDLRGRHHRADARREDRELERRRPADVRLCARRSAGPVHQLACDPRSRRGGHPPPGPHRAGRARRAFRDGAPAQGWHPDSRFDEHLAHAGYRGADQRVFGHRARCERAGRDA